VAGNEFEGFFPGREVEKSEQRVERSARCHECSDMRVMDCEGPAGVRRRGERVFPRKG